MCSYGSLGALRLASALNSLSEIINIRKGSKCQGSMNVGHFYIHTVVNDGKTTLIWLTYEKWPLFKQLLITSQIDYYCFKWCKSISDWLHLTYAWWQRVVPGTSLPCHALEYAAAMQRVARVTLVGDGAAREVALVIHLVAKLGHAGILTMWQLEAWNTYRSRCWRTLTDKRP